MSDLIRILANAFFGTRWVVLIDHDGERFIRRIYFSGSQAMANRNSFRPIELLDNGVVRGVSYVQRWVPYNPREPKKYPVFDASGASS